MSNESKILLLSLSGIGNFLMHTPVFRAIKKHMPGAEITVWVAPRNTYNLAVANEDIDKVFKAPIKRSLFGHLKQIIKLRNNDFDTGVVLYPGQLYKSAAYLFFSGVGKRVGHKYPHMGNEESSLFLTDAFEASEGTHDIEQNLKLLEGLGLKDTEVDKPYYLSLPEKSKRQGDNFIKTMQRQAKKELLIGLHPGTAKGYEWKRWPVDNFIETAKALVRNKKAHVVIFGSSNEMTEMKRIQKAVGKKDSTIVNRKLLVTAAVIGHCDLFISNDSGLMHMASAQDVPTIGLFGPTSETRTEPRGEKSFVVRAAETAPVYDINKLHDLGDEPHSSMKKIKPEQVLSATEQFLV